jgi:formylglycine-generating enzyme required for sulfatase activity
MIWSKLKFLRATLCAAAMAVCAVSAQAVSIDLVPVGNAGNGNDIHGDGYGAVGYNYWIGTYEVTIGQYAEFLNAVAKTDTYGVYNPFMADPNIAGISRTGASGSYSYSVIGSANKPVASVSWGDAVRFANWLYNGQPTGAQNSRTTEDGSYTLNGAVSDAAINAVTRNPGATWVLPSENEWYKAAYHKNDGVTSNFWDYPTGTDSEPNSDNPPVDPAIAANVANFYRDDGIANGYNDGYAMTSSTSYSGAINYLSDVGSYNQSGSPYGTFDQGGNLFEWNEALISGSFRGLRGGAWINNSLYQLASNRNSYSPSSLIMTFGFRVAMIPEPTSNTLALCAAVGLWRLRRRRT